MIGKILTKAAKSAKASKKAKATAKRNASYKARIKKAREKAINKSLEKGSTKKVAISKGKIAADKAKIRVKKSKELYKTKQRLIKNTKSTIKTVKNIPQVLSPLLNAKKMGSKAIAATAKKLGVSEFKIKRIQRLLELGKINPSVDGILNYINKVKDFPRQKLLDEINELKKQNIDTVYERYIHSKITGTHNVTTILDTYFDKNADIKILENVKRDYISRIATNKLTSSETILNNFIRSYNRSGNSRLASFLQKQLKRGASDKQFMSYLNYITQNGSLLNSLVTYANSENVDLWEEEEVIALLEDSFFNPESELNGFNNVKTYNEQYAKYQNKDVKEVLLQDIKRSKVTHLDPEAFFSKG